jgi:hypothetical protein
MLMERPAFDAGSVRDRVALDERQPEPSRSRKKTAGRVVNREKMANLLRWCFEEEHVSHLTQPKVARYVIETTKELADLLGISLDEGIGKSKD